MSPLRATHYIPSFTRPGRDRWNQQQAVCGEWVDVTDHTNEPTCATCAAWLVQDNSETLDDDEPDLNQRHDPRR